MDWRCKVILWLIEKINIFIIVAQRECPRYAESQITKPKIKEKKVKFNVPLQATDFHELKAIAEEKGITYSTILTALIDDFSGDIVEVGGELVFVNLAMDAYHIKQLDGIVEQLKALSDGQGGTKVSSAALKATVLRSMIRQFVTKDGPREYTITYKLVL